MLGLSICVLVLMASTPVAGAQITIFEARPTSSSTYFAKVGVLSQMPSTLHVFVEEYPIGSGCSGSVHQTNGGADYPVHPGGSTLNVSVPHFGGGYGHGFVRIGARLDDSPPTYYGQYCFRF
jgi:hypothetical protein